MKIQNIGSLVPTRSLAGVLMLAAIVAVMWLLGGGVQRAGAVPGNDNFASATAIGSLPYTVTQNNAGATTETNEPLPCGAKGATAWWRFTPTVDMSVTADTAGSVYDTVLAVYNGNSLTTLVNMGCQNAVSGVGTETVTFTARAGVTYRIQLGGASGAAGNATLNVGGTAVGGIPSTMSYQGRLTDSGGAPVADGTYEITFRIFDDATAGTNLWSETQQVAVSGGLFNVLLGGKVPLTASLFSGPTRFLEVQVTGDPAMTPRQRLATVPYAMAANRLIHPVEADTFGPEVPPQSGWRTLSNLRGATILSDGHIYVNYDGPDGDQCLCFYNAGTASGEVLKWDEGNDRFEFSDDLNVTGVYSGSDRNAKANFETVDRGDLLDRLAGIPIESWTFKDDGAAVRHIGPSAQDFKAAFSVGADDKSIYMTDANGVALASIQELYDQLQAERARNDSLEARLSALEDGNGGGASAQAASASSGGDGWVLLTVVPLSVLFGLALAGLLGGWALRRRTR